MLCVLSQLQVLPWRHGGEGTCQVQGRALRGSFMEDKGCWTRKVHSASKLVVEGTRAETKFLVCRQEQLVMPGVPADVELVGLKWQERT